MDIRDFLKKVDNKSQKQRADERRCEKLRLN